MAYQFFEYTDKIRPEWDTFVIDHKYGSVHQVSHWKSFQEGIPGRGEVKGYGVIDEKSGKIVATTFLVKMETGFMGKYWYYSARGPVFDPKTHSEAGLFLIKNIVQGLESTPALFWRIDPYFSPEEATSFYEENWKKATQNYQPENTLEIDLTQEDDEILAGMKRKGRYNIKLATKKGVTVEVFKGNEVREKDMSTFWDLNTETTGRDGFSGHQKNYYRDFCKKLGPYVALFFAKAEDGTPIASAISTFCGKKAIYYFGASTSDRNYRNLMAPYLLQWEMMRYAKEKGCESYDFLGIAPENQPDHPYAGISEFKWKFGGNRKIYAPGREWVFNKGWYGGYRALKWLKK